MSPWLAVLIVPRLAAASGATEAAPPTHAVAVSAGLDLDPSGSGLIAASLGLEVGRGRVRARLYGDVALLHAGAEQPGWEASPRIMLGLTLAF